MHKKNVENGNNFLCVLQMHYQKKVVVKLASLNRHESIFGIVCKMETRGVLRPKMVQNFLINEQLLAAVKSDAS